MGISYRIWGGGSPARQLALANSINILVIQSGMAQSEKREHQKYYNQHKMLAGDILKIPKLNFNITRDYAEICNIQFKSENPKLAGAWLEIARQSIVFKLDEKGARLRSAFFAWVPKCAPLKPRETPYVMVFDKPFLLMLKRRGRKMPYFAVWVDNPEILVKE